MMEIQYPNVNRKFRDLGGGDVFTYQGKAFMALCTGEEEAANLDTGIVVSFDKNDEVCLCEEAVLILEGKK